VGVQIGPRNFSSEMRRRPRKSAHLAWL
jgi:hypothetical protein